MRTIAQIYQEIVAYKDSQSVLQSLAPSADTEQQLLASLNSTSKVAIWRLWAYITAVAIWTHETLWELFLSEVKAAADAAVTGTAPWYQAQAFAYQHGDSLVYDAATGRYKYATVNAASQVIKRCAVVEQQSGILAIKVAKLNGSGLPIALSAPEQTGFVSYLKKVRFAGTRFTLFSGDGDIITIPATVYYEAIIPLPTLKANIEAAIQAYIGGLPFNGELLLSRLVDAIQVVEGVTDVVLSAVKTKAAPADAYASIVRAHVPVYGYYKIDTSTGFTLNDSVTYVAQ